MRPARAGSSGQSLVEFALVLPVLLTIAVSVIAFLPAITARGATLEAAASALERATAYLAPRDATPAATRPELCAVVYETAVAQLRGATAAGLTPLLSDDAVTATGTCTEGANAASGPSRLVVDVRAVDEEGDPLDSAFEAGTRVEVCVGYRFEPEGGIWWLLPKGNSVIALGEDLFVFRYCGIDTIESLMRRASTRCVRPSRSTWSNPPLRTMPTVRTLSPIATSKIIAALPCGPRLATGWRPARRRHWRRAW